jgi:hypothetical protein
MLRHPSSINYHPQKEQALSLHAGLETVQHMYGIIRFFPLVFFFFSLEMPQRPRIYAHLF